MEKTMSLTLLWLAVILLMSSRTRGSVLNITVATDKQEYGFAESVSVNGSLSSDGLPVADSLVGVEVRDPADLPFVFRTRPTDTIITNDWLVNFTSLYPCDSNGNPKYSFTKGQTVYIFFTIKNFDPYSEHHVTACMVLYDDSDVPIGAWYPISTNLNPGASTSVLYHLIKISDEVAIGTAKIYANAYSKFPRDGGFPYCAEKEATFSITESTLASTTLSSSVLSSSQNGTYSLSFRIKSDEARIGTYTIYVSSYYGGQLATSSTTFNVTLRGDINHDGIVNYLDAIRLGAAFGSSLNEPNWDPDADLNIPPDNVINYLDAIILGTNFGKKVFGPH